MTLRSRCQIEYSHGGDKGSGLNEAVVRYNRQPVMRISLSGVKFELLKYTSWRCWKFFQRFQFEKRLPRIWMRFSPNLFILHLNLLYQTREKQFLDVPVNLLRNLLKMQSSVPCFAKGKRQIQYLPLLRPLEEILVKLEKKRVVIVVLSNLFRDFPPKINHLSSSILHLVQKVRVLFRSYRI